MEVERFEKCRIHDFKMMFIKYLENHINHQALVCRSIKKTKHEDNCGVSAREAFLPQASLASRTDIPIGDSQNFNGTSCNKY
jgi:hypothetical protein